MQPFTKSMLLNDTLKACCTDRCYFPVMNGARFLEGQQTQSKARGHCTAMLLTSSDMLQDSLVLQQQAAEECMRALRICRLPFAARLVISDADTGQVSHI